MAAGEGGGGAGAVAGGGTDAVAEREGETDSVEAEQEAVAREERAKGGGDVDPDSELPVFPPGPDYSMCANRPVHMLEDIYARMFQGERVKKDDITILDSCIEIAKHTVERQLRSRAERETDGQPLIMPAEACACLVCYAILLEPWTLSCGHTLCRGCWERIKKCPQPGSSCRDAPSFVMLTADRQVARQPGSGTTSRRESAAVLNRTLQKLVSRAFPNEEAAQGLKSRANAHLAQGQLEQAVALYREAVALSGGNHILQGNLAQAYLLQGEFEQALIASLDACKLMPWWHKAHFRRGCALQGLTAYTEALASFAKCAALIKGNLECCGGFGATHKDLVAARSKVLELWRYAILMNYKELPTNPKCIIDHVMVCVCVCVCFGTGNSAALRDGKMGMPRGRLGFQKGKDRDANRARIVRYEVFSYESV